MCSYFFRREAPGLNGRHFQPNALFDVARSMGLVGSIIFAAVLAGCSLHPIPDDVSFGRIPTEQIVARARCEMRAGLLELAVAQILTSEERSKFKKKIVEENEKIVMSFESAKTNPEVRRLINKFKSDYPPIGSLIEKIKEKYNQKFGESTQEKKNADVDAAIAALEAIAKGMKPNMGLDSTKAKEEAIKTLRVFFENHRVVLELEELDQNPGALANITADDLEELVDELQTAKGRGALDETVRDIIKNNSATMIRYLADYSSVAVAYDFDFQITESNELGASVGLRAPWSLTNILDVGAEAKLNKTRVGKRTFSAQETFGEITVSKDHWCDKQAFRGPSRNIVYPMTGSIGLRKVVRTFVQLVEQGGGKDSFVDALTFTTEVGGGLKASVKLKEVPDSFRVINAAGGVAGERTDLHSIKVSLVFPKKKEEKKPGDTEVQCRQHDPGSVLSDYNDVVATCEDEKGNHYRLNPVWLARFNLCIADGRDREDRLKVLRFSAPEMYCVTYANALVPRRATAPGIAGTGSAIRLRQWWFSG